MSFHGLLAHLFSALNNIPLSGCPAVYFFIHSLRNLGFFQVLTIMSRVAINICVHALCGYKFSTLFSNTKKHDWWLYGKSMFSFVRNHQNVLQSVCTILHSHQQWMRVPVVLHSYQHLGLSVFWILAILIGVQWYLIVFICISLMTCDVEQLFICLSGICIFSSVKCQLRSLAHFFFN